MHKKSVIIRFSFVFYNNKTKRKVLSDDEYTATATTNIHTVSLYDFMNFDEV